MKVTVEHAALDPFRGYANAIRDELPDAVAVLDAFHVVKLASNAPDEVRRRVQQTTCIGAGTRTTRSTRSAAPCSPARSTSPTDSVNGSPDTSRPVIRTPRSRSPGGSTGRSAPSTTPTTPPPAERARRRSSSPYTPARSPRSSDSARPCAAGGKTSLPTSPPAVSATVLPRPSTVSSRRPDGSRTASGTSPTTGSAPCSPPTAHAPTDAAHRSDPNHDDLGRAVKGVPGHHMVGLSELTPNTRNAVAKFSDRRYRPSRRRIPERDRDRVVELYKSGLSFARVAEQSGIACVDD